MSFSSEKQTPAREQLELAAKAAGLFLKWGNLNAAYVKNEDGVLVRWNPTTSKPDSFDLMVACEIDIKHTESYVAAIATKAIRCSYGIYYKDHNNDKGLATMWAVFLCAVEIGKSFTNGRAM
jgi:hypothetical protein